MQSSTNGNNVMVAHIPVQQYATDLDKQLQPPIQRPAKRKLLDYSLSGNKNKTHSTYSLLIHIRATSKVLQRNNSHQFRLGTSISSQIGWTSIEENYKDKDYQSDGHFNTPKAKP
jgi:hypothetical protein